MPYSRQLEIIRRIALKANALPVLDSGLWFQQDVRDNFYYASYLLAAACNSEMELPFDRDAARAKASQIMAETLALQDRNPQSPTYGHWPLQLLPTPREAKPHVLPVELMGSLIVHFSKKNSAALDESLREAFVTAISHIYAGGFFRKPLLHFNHHDAKYTAAKLIFGQHFADEALLADGLTCLKETLARIRAAGMSEYGSLPWFWHWVQGFTAAWELADRSDIKFALAEMLDYLWSERSQFYLRGAWAGPHSRMLPHDIPIDANVLFDYVQYGDFVLPAALPRTEYAGFLFYEASETVRKSAMNRAEPSEVKKRIPRPAGNDLPPLHAYLYLTEHFASGGMWERVDEFANEQHRWDVTFPLREGGEANQLFFFHPGAGHSDPDFRHQSGWAEVLYDRNVIAALYPIPDGQPDTLIGVLPKGEWLEERFALFGLCNQVFVAVYLMQPYRLREEKDYYRVTGEGTPNGVVIEAVPLKDAEALGLRDLPTFAAAMRKRQPAFVTVGAIEVSYSSLTQRNLQLTIAEDGRPDARVDGENVDLSEYTP